MTLFISGAMFGGVIGVVTMCVMVVAKNADQRM